MTPAQFFSSMGTGPELVLLFVGAAVSGSVVVFFTVMGIRSGVLWALDTVANNRAEREHRARMSQFGSSEYEVRRRRW